MEPHVVGEPHGVGGEKDAWDFAGAGKGKTHGALRGRGKEAHGASYCRGKEGRTEPRVRGKRAVSTSRCRGKNAWNFNGLGERVITTTRVCGKRTTCVLFVHSSSPEWAYS